MPGTKIRWGVIGSGGIARRRTIPEGLMQANCAELTAVFDVNAEANNEVAAEFGAAACRVTRTVEAIRLAVMRTLSS